MFALQLYGFQAFPYHSKCTAMDLNTRNAYVLKNRHPGCCKYKKLLNKMAQ